MVETKSFFEKSKVILHVVSLSRFASVSALYPHFLHRCNSTNGDAFKITLRTGSFGRCKLDADVFTYYGEIVNGVEREVKDFIDNRLVMVSKYIGVGKDYE